MQSEQREAAPMLVISKILVLEEADVVAEPLKSFCEENHLMGIRPCAGRRADVTRILKSNIDLGGVLLYENLGGPGQGLTLASEIHAARPELPLFLRRDSVASMAGLSEREAAMFRCAYTLNHLDLLRMSLGASIFNRIYPNGLVRGITEISRSSLQHVFRNCRIDIETPYLVKDRFIYGEVSSMISIDSHWCRGYMMMQAEEDAILALIRNRIDGYGSGAGFRDLNSVLGEATNLIWGAFRNRYVSVGKADGVSATQVPILINHQRRYICFGSEDPQLCIQYRLWAEDDPEGLVVPVYQRFVFNMNWAPEDFQERSAAEALADAGELELF